VRIEPDLASLVDSIAHGQMEAMGPEAMLGVIADLLAELPRLEGRMRLVAEVLSEVRQSSASGIGASAKAPRPEDP